MYVINGVYLVSEEYDFKFPYNSNREKKADDGGSRQANLQMAAHVQSWLPDGQEPTCGLSNKQFQSKCGVKATR